MTPISGAVFHRVLDKQTAPGRTIARVLIETADGRRFLDASGGAVVVNVGHGREEIARAVFEQLRRLPTCTPRCSPPRPSRISQPP